MWRGGSQTNCSLNRCSLAWSRELKEWQIDLPRIRNETAQMVTCTPCFFETGTAVSSLIWSKVFGKDSGFLFSLWKSHTVGRFDVVTAWKYFLLDYMFCWEIFSVGKVGLVWMNPWGRMKVQVNHTSGSLWAVSMASSEAKCCQTKGEGYLSRALGAVQFYEVEVIWSFMNGISLFWGEKEIYQTIEALAPSVERETFIFAMLIGKYLFESFILF